MSVLGSRDSSSHHGETNGRMENGMETAVYVGVTFLTSG